MIYSILSDMVLNKQLWLRRSVVIDQVWHQVRSLGYLYPAVFSFHQHPSSFLSVSLSHWGWFAVFRLSFHVARFLLFWNNLSHSHSLSKITLLLSLADELDDKVHTAYSLLQFNDVLPSRTLYRSAFVLSRYLLLVYTCVWLNWLSASFRSHGNKNLYSFIHSFLGHRNERNQGVQFSDIQQMEGGTWLFSLSVGSTEWPSSCTNVSDRCLSAVQPAWRYLTLTALPGNQLTGLSAVPRSFQLTQC